MEFLRGVTNMIHYHTNNGNDDAVDAVDAINAIVRVI
jgi:hypothetical protein